jgi:catechol 2,3-dioxygenase-like lactoylglutathione lyase family enzyme
MYPIRRLILFTHRLAAMRDFYRDVIGMTVVEEDKGWIDLASGGCNIALHAAAKPATDIDGTDMPHKITFYAEDVAAARADLVARGAKLGMIKTFGTLHLCDGADPDGNRVQLSNRS